MRAREPLTAFHQTTTLDLGARNPRTAALPEFSEQEEVMQRRVLGKTGLELTIIGFGGYHLIEVPRKEVDHLLNAYLDAGGNYIETAAQYGDGLSEKKIGEAVSGRRDGFILATKTVKRTHMEALASLEESLKNLRTDHVDIFYMHEPQTVDEAKQIMASGGAMEAAQEAKRAGKTRFIGVSDTENPLGFFTRFRTMTTTF